jgi:hypothetical protein
LSVGAHRLLFSYSSEECCIVRQPGAGQTSHVRVVSSGEVLAVAPGEVFVVEGARAQTAVEDADEAVADDA